ncbi:YaiI/YqxD family protein [Ectobacillus antri]|jgi:uncharacterized protein YaiI (UPF0178 family)|uniref:UPF0178 protein P6P90_04505 n=1 Tax=Ectobacillus antri TaxID=2486280 RepID=A0ABT6H3G9_9BACI|nr:YaiI/YqxD family protein [Ectobacillus antri]MDG4655501.1 YaiI/YqxD family protein [Ectobacillus antri]MDG5753259.1 YaiI/YqxD family protein [Ectobacillus antri]
MLKSKRIFVDADACPVKQEIVDACKPYEIEVYFIASHAHRTNFGSGTWIYVDSLQDEVDFAIFQRADAGDIVVTQDMGLAALLVKKKVIVISPRGILIQDEQIDCILHSRYVSAKLRRQGTFTKGPKAFTKEDRERFSNMLQKILSNHEGIH